MQGLVHLMYTCITHLQCLFGRRVRETAVMMPRVPQSLVLHQVTHTYLAVIDNSLQCRRHRSRVVEGSKRINIYMKTTFLQSHTYLVGKA